MNELEKVDYTIPGTKLPTLPPGTRYFCSDWKRDGTIDQFTDPRDYFFSHGTTIEDGKTYIQADTVDYSGSNYYLIALSDIVNPIKQQHTAPVEEWANGTYVVFIKPYGCSAIGDVDQIIEDAETYSIPSPDSSTCYCKKEWVTTKDPEYVKWFATIEEAAEFSKLITNKKQEMKTIKYSDAQRIVDIACSTWKDKLFVIWGHNIVLKQDIEITGKVYQEMRNACTSEQNRIFDEIFGVDHNFKVGDWVIAKNGGYKARQVVSINNTHVKFIQSDIYTIDYCRLATVEEINAAIGFSDGTPCLVRDTSNSEWRLRYSDGKGEFYVDCKKSGKTLEWRYSRKLDMNNLPLNL
jgi:hypothetical protein